ncbi:hypothetical protein B0J11DRAFT_542350 [Dendryphion nanum]|uniref:Heterokaryon incompatibility domain-containing protein n=1 Tax=Dendryphion nanum TaxID=256645 RepID=A0A9P9IAZ2_9PLEO|nr:hypothetical protein B0J11DRAFT_542350 [Dendryphion nanum]
MRMQPENVASVEKRRVAEVEKRLATLRKDASRLDRQHYINLMLDQGWCTHQVHYLAKKYDFVTFSYLAELPLAPERREDHATCSHYPSCVVYNVDMNNYTPAHRTPDCGCKSVSAPYDELTRIISERQVPLINIEQSEDPGRMTLRLHARTMFTKYVSVSHVWADGLGNPAENALPACQLTYLAARLHDIYGHSNCLFWFDTLCIPVKKEHEKLRDLSIDNMASIYAGANAVLVLDRELMNTKPVSLQECLARITCSVWMCRSWTLQEGILAHRCLFQFNGFTLVAESDKKADKVDWRFVESKSKSISVSRNASTQPVDHERERQLDRTFWSQNKKLADWATRCALENFFTTEFFGIQWSSQRSHQRFIHVWNALAGRSTTKTEDLVLILANLVGYNAEKLVSLHPNQRLAAIICSLDKIPFGLLFDDVQTFDRHPSIFASWMPTQLSRNMLDATPFLIKCLDVSWMSIPDHLLPTPLRVFPDRITNLMHFPRHYELHTRSSWPDTVDWYHDLEIYEMKQIIPQALERMKVLVPKTRTLFTFFSPARPRVELLNPDLFQGTCLIVRKPGSDPNSCRRGALFSIAKNKDRLARQSGLYLYYRGSMQIERRLYNQKIMHAQLPNEFEAVMLNREIQPLISFSCSFSRTKTGLKFDSFDYFWNFVANMIVLYVALQLGFGSLKLCRLWWRFGRLNNDLGGLFFVVGLEIILVANIWFLRLVRQSIRNYLAWQRARGFEFDRQFAYGYRKIRRVMATGTYEIFIG